MSATLNIPFVRQLDARLAQNPDNKIMSVATPGSQVTPRVENSNSGSGNTSNISFTMTPNSPANVIGRDFIVAVKVRQVFSGITLLPLTSRALLATHCDAPRSLSSCIQSTNLTINGLTISQETAETYHAFQHFNQTDEMVKFQSLTPGLMAPDYTQTYEDVYKTLVNPLAPYRDSTRARWGRGSYPFTIIENIENSATVEYTLYELLTLSPLVFDSGLYPGLCNVNSMQLQFTLQNLNRLWSHNSGRYSLGGTEGAGTEIQSISTTFTDAKVYFTEITPPVYLTIPPVCSLSYYDVQRQTTSNGTKLGAQQSADFVSNSYQLNTVPSRIIVYVKERSSNITSTTQKATETPDCYARINSISIQYNNNSSLLSQADISQLYGMSSRNGVDMGFQEFVGNANEIKTVTLGSTSYQLGLTGSILALDVGRDITSDSTALPGTSVNANFSIQVNATNPKFGYPGQPPVENETTYDLTILYVYAGLLIISPGSCYKYSTLLTREQVLNIPLVEGSSKKTLTGGDATGFFGGMKSGLSKPWQHMGRVKSGSEVEGSGNTVPSDTKLKGGRKGGNIYQGSGLVNKKSLKERSNV